MAAGEAIAAKTNQAPEEQKNALAESHVRIANNKAKETSKARPEKDVSPDINIAVNPDTRNVLTTTQWLIVVSIFVSMVGIYYKREEIKRVFTKRLPQTPEPSITCGCSPAG